MKEKVTLAPINRVQSTITIKGISPLVTHKWDEKAIRQMEEKHSGKKTKSREARIPEDEFKAAMYKTEDGQYAIPVMAVKKSIINAAHKDLGIEKTLVRKSLFVLSEHRDGVFEVLPLRTDEPIMRRDCVRVGNGSTDLRYRPEFNNWECDVKIEYDSTNLNMNDIVNLVNRAGFGVGLCEQRPEKGGDWGRFEVKTS